MWQRRTTRERTPGWSVEPGEGGHSVVVRSYSYRVGEGCRCIAEWGCQRRRAMGELGQMSGTEHCSRDVNGVGRNQRSWDVNVDELGETNGVGMSTSTSWEKPTELGCRRRRVGRNQRSWDVNVDELGETRGRTHVLVRRLGVCPVRGNRRVDVALLRQQTIRYICAHRPFG